MNRMDAESAVLGGIMLDSQAYWRVADILTAEDFAEAEHRQLWDTVAQLHRDGLPADPVTVGERYPALCDLAMRVAINTASTANIRAYAEMVQSSAVNRRVNVAGQQIARLKGTDALAEAQALIAGCVPRDAAAVKPIREYLRETVAVMAQRCEATEVLTGVETSLPWLDEMTGGWQRGDMIILAARPSVGKTALALQCAIHAALTGKRVLFFSLEQSGAQIAERTMAHVSGVSLQSILQPKRIEEHEWPKITAAGSKIDAMPLLIDESGALTVDAICARARQANAAQRLGLIVIDYLTQITPPKANTTADAVQGITRQIKALAKALGVPIILLSQLNRDGESRPKLTHLRDSGAIEQDADVVLFLHRQNEEQRDLIELTIAKQRNGECDSRYLRAHMAQMRFIETEDKPVAKVTNRGFGDYSKRREQNAA